MTDLSTPTARAVLASALGVWLPAQRWYAGKARGLDRVDVVDIARLDDRVWLAFVDVTDDAGGQERYCVPLAAVEPATIGVQAVARLDGAAVVDALDDVRAATLLAQLAARGGHRPTSAGRTVVGQPVTGAAPGPADVPRRLDAEQSNSSVVYGRRYILKLFRRLEPGVHPDVELTRALTRGGFAHVPAQHAALVLTGGDAEQTALAVLSDFVDGREGWALALAETNRLAAGSDDVSTPLLDRMTDLGVAVAALHGELAYALGTAPMSPDQLAAESAAMQRQADEVLALAAARARSQTAAVVARWDELSARFGDLTGLGDAGRRARVHGDLHLGQVLLDADGRWQLLDFEGEPARRLEQRRAPQSPLRDVAGVLRSFDYVIAQTAREVGGQAAPSAGAPAPALVSWRARARQRFLDGYRSAASRARLLPTDPVATATLLAAFELDKAVYELGYELANRPDWVAIPVRGILRLLDADDRATTGTLS